MARTVYVKLGISMTGDLVLFLPEWEDNIL